MLEEEKKLIELIKNRIDLRVQEKRLTDDIKKLRKSISEKKRKEKPPKNIALKEAREKVIALRIACGRALKDAGYTNSQISKIMDISCSRLMQHKQEYKQIGFYEK